MTTRYAYHNSICMHGLPSTYCECSLHYRILHAVLRLGSTGEYSFLSFCIGLPYSWANTASQLSVPVLPSHSCNLLQCDLCARVYSFGMLITYPRKWDFLCNVQCRLWQQRHHPISNAHSVMLKGEWLRHTAEHIWQSIRFSDMNCIQSDCSIQFRVQLLVFEWLLFSNFKQTCTCAITSQIWFAIHAGIFLGVLEIM